jgi:uncharacterized protein YqgV (UPF0045/DUF77 family)
MNKGRFLHEEKIKDHSNVGVYGIFSTTKVEWKYYVISYNTTANGGLKLTSELCSYTQEATFESVSRQGKEYKTVEEAKQFIQEYKVKWESGSNNTTQEVRAKKLDDILDSDK